MFVVPMDEEQDSVFLCFSLKFFPLTTNTHFLLLLCLRVYNCHYYDQHLSISVTEHYFPVSYPKQVLASHLLKSSAKSSGGFCIVHPYLVCGIEGDWFPICNSDLISVIRKKIIWLKIQSDLSLIGSGERK